MAYSYIQLKKAVNELQCNGCSQIIPVDGFFLSARRVSLCVDCSQQLSKINRRMGRSQVDASRPVWFNDPRQYVSVLRIRHHAARNLYEVKTIDSGHWYKTCEDFFTYLMKVRRYQIKEDENHSGFTVYAAPQH